MSTCQACLRPLARRTTSSFCPSCQQEVFGGRDVSARLRFLPPHRDEAIQPYLDQLQRISLSGVQEKYSVRFAEDGELALADTGGQYLLKPIPPGRFLHLSEVPANEHLTMQLARQVFNLNTAACALVRFTDDSPAYLTRRFDVQSDGQRNLQEDFAQLAGLSEDLQGPNYKYEFSYEEIAALISKHIPVLRILAIDQFFRLTLFNYLISNGDAHAKNFSVYLDSSTGAYRLTPAYDLLCTRLHTPNEPDLALSLCQSHETESLRANGFVAYDDWLDFGIRIGLRPERVRGLLKDIVGQEKKITTLINRSGLSPALRQQYEEYLTDRRTRLRYSMTGLV